MSTESSTSCSHNQTRSNSFEYAIYSNIGKFFNSKKKTRVKQKEKPAPWENSTFKFNPLHFESTEFEENENYSNYVDPASHFKTKDSNFGILFAKNNQIPNITKKNNLKVCTYLTYDNSLKRSKYIIYDNKKFDPYKNNFRLCRKRNQIKNKRFIRRKKRRRRKIKKLKNRAKKRNFNYKTITTKCKFFDLFLISKSVQNVESKTNEHVQSKRSKLSNKQIFNRSRSLTNHSKLDQKHKIRKSQSLIILDTLSSNSKNCWIHLKKHTNILNEAKNQSNKLKTLIDCYSRGKQRKSNIKVLKKNLNNEKLRLESMRLKQERNLFNTKLSHISKEKNINLNFNTNNNDFTIVTSIAILKSISRTFEIETEIPPDPEEAQQSDSGSTDLVKYENIAELNKKYLSEYKSRIKYYDSQLGVGLIIDSSFEQKVSPDLTRERRFENCLDQYIYCGIKHFLNL